MAEEELCFSPIFSKNDLFELEDLLTLLYRENDLYNYSTDESLKILLEKLGILFRMKQLWLQSALLIKLSNDIGLSSDNYSCNSEAIEHFLKTAKLAGLEPILRYWLSNK